MLANLRRALLALVVLTLSSRSEATAAKPLSPLIGTWRLFRFENTDVKGVTVKPFGEHPKGYFVYDPTGHLSVQIMGTPRMTRFAANAPGEEDSVKATDAEVRVAYNNYVAYFGT